MAALTVVSVFALFFGVAALWHAIEARDDAREAKEALARHAAEIMKLQAAVRELDLPTRREMEYLRELGFEAVPVKTKRASR